MLAEARKRVRRICGAWLGAGVDVTARTDLIDATKDLLAERGYVSVSPRDIQVRAAVGQGSMYHHFRGKSDLAGTAVQQVSAEMCEAADALLDGADPLAAVLAWLTAPRTALRGCRLGRLVAEPILDEPLLLEPIAAYFHYLQHRLSERLDEARRNGSLRSGLDPLELAAAVVAVVQGGYVLARATADERAMQRAQRGAAALLAAHRPARPSSEQRA